MGMDEPSPLHKRAAQYVRVSTEHQRYAIENQIIALRNYAEKHDLEIVRTYSDRGISGLKLHKRTALKQLLKDVVSGHADFSKILVYDVSRWGRFQDADESAHYEFLCRQSGIQIEYCAEQFENDGSPISTIVKSMKRVMAAEYSRDLSKRVFNGQQRVVESGYRNGGMAGFGYRRLLLDEYGVPKGIMEDGHRKGILTDRVILVRGPSEEVDLVRWIFQSCADGQSIKSIARQLRASDLPVAKKRRWSDTYVGYLLRNEKYVGDSVWNRTSAKMRGPKLRNPRCEWVRAEGAFEAIVSRELFDKARQMIIQRRTPPSEEELLEGLRTLLDENGYLTRDLITADKRTPSRAVYDKQFGSIANAYQKVGYSPGQCLDYLRLDGPLRTLRQEICAQAAQAISNKGRNVSIRRGRQSITVDSKTEVFFKTVRCGRHKNGNHFWMLRSLRKANPTIVVAVRMNPGDEKVRDFYLIPGSEFRQTSTRLYDRKRVAFDIYRSDTLAPLYKMFSHRLRDSEPIGDQIVRAITTIEIH